MSLTPFDILEKIHAAQHSLKYIQDVSILVFHYISIENFHLNLYDLQTKSIIALPTTWNSAASTVFLRYVSTPTTISSFLGETKIPSGLEINITFKFARKDNGTMDIHVKTGTNVMGTDGQPVSISSQSKTIKISTLDRAHLKNDTNGGILKNTSELVLDNFIPTSNMSDCGDHNFKNIKLLQNIFDTFTSTIHAHLDTIYSFFTNNSDSTFTLTSSILQNAQKTETPAQTAQSSTSSTEHPKASTYFVPIIGSHPPTPSPTQTPSIHTDSFVLKTSIAPSDSLPTMSSNNRSSNDHPKEQHLNLPTTEKGLNLPQDSKTQSTTTTTSDRHQILHPASASASTTSTNNPSHSQQPSKQDIEDHIHPKLSGTASHQPHSSRPPINNDPPGLSFDPATNHIPMTDKGPALLPPGQPSTSSSSTHDPFQGGNLMGPGQVQGMYPGNNPGGNPQNFPTAPGFEHFPPNHRPRFDPYDPFPSSGEPDNDHLRLPRNGPNGNFGGPNSGRGTGPDFNGSFGINGAPGNRRNGNNQDPRNQFGGFGPGLP